MIMYSEGYTVNIDCRETVLLIMIKKIKGEKKRLRNIRPFFYLIRTSMND